MEQLVQTLIGMLIGAIAVAIAGWIFAKQNAAKVAKWISKAAVKITRGDLVKADEIEDLAGDWLIALGKELKNQHKIGKE